MQRISKTALTIAGITAVALASIAGAGSAPGPVQAADRQAAPQAGPVTTGTDSRAEVSAAAPSTVSPTIATPSTVSPTRESPPSASPTTAAQTSAPPTTAAASTEIGIYWVGFATPEQLKVLTSQYDVLEAREGNEIAVLADKATIAKLRQAGFTVRLDQLLSPSAGLGAAAASGSRQQAGVALAYYGGYRTKAEQYAHLDAAIATYPTLVVGYDYGDSWKKVHGLGGSDLRVVCVTKLQAGDCQLTPNSIKPRSMIMAAIHARELTPAEIAYRYIDMLTAGYGVDADITALLDNTEVWIIPVVNPDGREIVEQGGNAPYLQRKNANNTAGACSNPPTVSNQFGVDLNRNADFQWGGIGTSAAPCDQTYKGTSAASEPEQQALQALWAKPAALDPRTKTVWRPMLSAPVAIDAFTASLDALNAPSVAAIAMAVPPAHGGVSTKYSAETTFCTVGRPTLPAALPYKPSLIVAARGAAAP